MQFLEVIATAGKAQSRILINPAHIVSAYPGNPEDDTSFVVLTGHENALEIGMPFDDLCRWLRDLSFWLHTGE